MNIDIRNQRIQQLLMLKNANKFYLKYLKDNGVEICEDVKDEALKYNVELDIDTLTKLEIERVEDEIKSLEKEYATTVLGINY